MVGRVRVEIVADGSYRLCEPTGELCYSWLPGYEEPDYLPLDRGGYEDKADAWAFKLGMDLIRAEAGLIAETPAQIERERLKLDGKSGRLPTVNPQDALDPFADRIRGQAPSLDDFARRRLRKMDGEPYPVTRHEVNAPIVEHRRIRTA